MVTTAGKDGLGMELDPFDGMLAVAKTHHEAVLGLGGQLERVGDRRSVNNERVIPRCFERGVEPGEHAHTPVLDERRLAVHHFV